jgi:DeoR/GlpR family transcriptional regulator of sugar metabolism
MRQGKAERHGQILAELDVSPSLRVAELAAKLNVSTETIRRDLDELTAIGGLNRTYGGAVRSRSSEPPVQERHRLFIAERERIARAALGVIGDAKILFIGSGSTTTHVARHIAAQLKNITVIVHSFGVASVLSRNPTIRVLMCPGFYEPSEGAMFGAYTMNFLSQFQADIALLGASGIGGGGPSDALLETGVVYSAMVARAAQTVLVADHSKFDLVFPARYALWSQVTHLVTDEPPGPFLAAQLEQASVAQHIADTLAR